MLPSLGAVSPRNRHGQCYRVGMGNNRGHRGCLMFGLAEGRCFFTSSNQRPPLETSTWLKPKLLTPKCNDAIAIRLAIGHPRNRFGVNLLNKAIDMACTSCRNSCKWKVKASMKQENSAGFVISKCEVNTSAHKHILVLSIKLVYATFSFFI